MGNVNLPGWIPMISRMNEDGYIRPIPNVRIMTKKHMDGLYTVLLNRLGCFVLMNSEGAVNE
jgi:hypothetical protein